MHAAPHFVGRERELALVQSRLHDAALGTGGALFFVGENGIGKTRLLTECAALKSPAVTVSLRFGTGLPGGEALAQLGRALRLAGARGAPPSLAQVLSAVAMRSVRKPLALFVDDAHLATAAEARLLSALVAMAAGERQRLTIVACGADRLHRIAGGEHARALEPLDETAMQLLVRGLVHPNASPVGDREIGAIVRVAQGNPRYGIELVQVRAASPDAPLVAPSASAAVAALRPQLSKAEFDVLCACSVVGDRFAAEWIVEVADRPRGVVADALQAGSDLGVLGGAGVAGWVAFRRAAIRAAFYASLVEFKRRILHERSVQRLCAQAPETDPGTRRARIALLGEHYETLRERAPAAAAFGATGDAFYEAGDFHAASDYYVRAIEHAERDAAQRLDLQRRALKAFEKTSDWGRQIPNALDALTLIDRNADPAAAGTFLSQLFMAYLNDGNHPEAERTAAEIAALDLPGTAVRAQVATFLLAYTYCYRGRVDKAMTLLTSIDPDAIVEWEARLRYLIAQAEAGALHEPLERTYARVEKAAELALPRAIRGTVVSYSTGNEIALRCGDLPTAWAYLARAAEVGERSEGQRNDVKLSVAKDRIRTHAIAGELRETRQLLRESLEWHASGRHNEAFDAGIAVMVGMHTGDLALVDAFFDPELLYSSVATRDIESCGRLLPGFAEVMTVRGAGKELRRVLEQCIGYDLIDPYGAVQLAAIRYGGDPEAAAAFAQIERHFGSALAPVGAAHVALARAMLRRRTGAAGDSAREAARRYKRLGWRLHEAIALELAGEIAGATRVYERCGASTDVARLTAAQTRKRRRAPFGARLTPRELEAARLVARKRSNAEIARALGVSVRTVDHHVEAAFSKLGIRARWQLTSDLLQ